MPILADVKKIQRDIETAHKHMSRDTGKENSWTLFGFNYRTGDNSTKASISKARLGQELKRG